MIKTIRFWDRVKVWFLGGTIEWTDGDRVVVSMLAPRFSWVDVWHVGPGEVRVNYDRQL